MASICASTQAATGWSTTIHFLRRARLPSLPGVDISCWTRRSQKPTPVSTLSGFAWIVASKVL